MGLHRESALPSSAHSPLPARSPRNPGPPSKKGSGSRQRRSPRAPSRGAGFPPRRRGSYWCRPRSHAKSPSALCCGSRQTASSAQRGRAPVARERCPGAKCPYMPTNTTTRTSSRPRSPRVPKSTTSRVSSIAFMGVTIAFMASRPRGPATGRSRASSTASTTAGRTRARPQARALHPGPTPPRLLTAGPRAASASATWSHLMPRLASSPATGPAPPPGLPLSPWLRLPRPLQTAPCPHAETALLGPRAHLSTTPRLCP